MNDDFLAVKSPKSEKTLLRSQINPFYKGKTWIQTETGLSKHMPTMCIPEKLSFIKNTILLWYPGNEKDAK